MGHDHIAEENGGLKMDVSHGTQATSSQGKGYRKVGFNNEAQELQAENLESCVPWQWRRQCKKEWLAITSNSNWGCRIWSKKIVLVSNKEVYFE